VIRLVKDVQPQPLIVQNVMTHKIEKLMAIHANVILIILIQVLLVFIYALELLAILDA